MGNFLSVMKTKNWQCSIPFRMLLGNTDRDLIRCESKILPPQDMVMMIGATCLLSHKLVYLIKDHALMSKSLKHVLFAPNL